MKHVLPLHALKSSRGLLCCVLPSQESKAGDNFITKAIKPPALPVVYLILLSFPLPDSRPLHMPPRRKIKVNCFHPLKSGLNFLYAPMHWTFKA